MQTNTDLPFERYQPVTDERKRVFLHELSIDGNVTRSARVAGFDHSNVYKLRSFSPEFSAAWASAVESAADALEAEALRRAVDGVRKPLYYQGQPVYLYRTLTDAAGEVMKGEDGHDLREVVRDDSGQPVQAVEYTYSDSLLATMLKGAKPEKYGDRSKVELTGSDGGPIQVEVGDTERARRIAFVLQRGLLAASALATQPAALPELGDDPGG